MEIIRVEAADTGEIAEREKQFSFGMRQRQQPIRGRIVAVNGYMYDVLIPGRAHPYADVPPCEPVKLEVGMVVWLGFVEDNPGLPFILAFRAEASSRTLTAGHAVPQIIAWTHDRAGPGRTSRAPWIKPRQPLVRCERMSGSFGEFPEVRVWDNQIFFTFATRTVGLLAMGDQYDPWLSGSDPVAPHYDLTPVPGLGSGRNGWALDRDGNFCFLWSSGASKASRDDLVTLWQAPITLSGHYILPGTIYVVPPTMFDAAEIAGLSVADGKLYAIRWNSDTGTEIERTPLTQTAAGEGGFVPGEDALFLSGGNFDGGWLPDTHQRYWDPNVSLVRSFPANPFGFLNGAAFHSQSYWQHIGERRFGIRQENMGASTAFWGPEPESPDELLQFVEIDGVLQHIDLSSRDKSRIIPMPRALHYLPTLVAYTATGAKAWEVLGWERTPDEPPYHYRDFFSPRMLHDGKIYTMTVRLTFETIDEEWAIINRVDIGFNHDDAYDMTVDNIRVTGVPYQIEYLLQEMLPRRSRRIVGIQTFFEAYSVESGVRLTSTPLVPQIKSKFVTRGEYKGELPPRHAITLTMNLPNGGSLTMEQYGQVAEAVLGYPIAGYWPHASTYFDRLEAGDFYAYGLYSDGGQQVPPVWFSPSLPWAEGRPERDIDYLEGDPYYDPYNNRGYSRIRTAPKYGTGYGPDPVGYMEWGCSGDANDNGSADTVVCPPPTAWLYDAVWHETHYDLPHVSNYAEPLMNTTGNLLIFPPLHPLGSALTLSGRKFEFSPGSNDYYSWSGGNLANRMNHFCSLEHPNWKTADRQVWEARDWSGNVIWTHTIERSEFGSVWTHEWARPACGGGELHIVYRINGGKPRLRRVNDSTGGLISDQELDAPSTPGDTGGIPHEVILAGDVTLFTTREHWDLDEDTWEFSVVGKPAVYGIYPDEEDS